MKKRSPRLKEIAQIAHDISSPLTMIKWFASAANAPAKMNDEVDLIKKSADTIKDQAKRNDPSLLDNLDPVVDKMANAAATFWRYVLQFNAEDESLAARKDLALKSLHKLGSLIASLNHPEKNTVTACDLAHVIDHALCETKPYAEQKGVRISHNFKSVTAVTDAQKINRVIVNILNNAIEAKGTNKIHLQMFLSDPFVRIEAFDNGDGIEAGSITKIFDRGFTSGKSGGSGLGLAFCRRTIEENGGRIAAHSTMGVGTIFAVTLPVRKIQGSPDDSLWE